MVHAKSMLLHVHGWLYLKLQMFHISIFRELDFFFPTFKVPIIQGKRVQRTLAILRPDVFNEKKGYLLFFIEYYSSLKQYVFTYV